MTTSRSKTPDLFDSIFDNLRTRMRELYRDGRLLVSSSLDAETALTRHFGMTGPWRTYPDLPSNPAPLSRKER